MVKEYKWSEEHKRCYGCETWLPISKFDGTNNCCRSCNRARPILRCLRDRYSQMVKRCTKPDNPSYKYYGGRGIEVRFESSADFVEYMLCHIVVVDLKGLTIDRINNNGHYEKGNIRLVTQAVNNRNRR